MKLQNGNRSLALHELAGGDGTPLLLLHALYGSSEDWRHADTGNAVAAWPGAVFALDFAGHGASDWISGGWYSAEACVTDADLALAQVGPAAVAGSGFGAYVALLLAGSRAQEVPAALLLAGAGLDGCGALPDFSNTNDPWSRSAAPAGASDPMSRCLEAEVRPIEYAQAFCDHARGILLAEDGGPRPPWWEALRSREPARVLEGDLGALLEALAAATEMAERAASTS